MNSTPRLPPLVPFTPAALFGAWKVGVIAFELWSTSLATIAMRSQLWATQAPTSARMMKENQRMVTEKLDGGLEVGLELQKAWFGMLFGQSSPWWITGHRTLKPLHRRTTANSRRLARRP